MADQVTGDFPEGCAFVLGGSGGLGRAICAAFARRGVPVALTYHRGEAAARETLALVAAEGVEADAYQLDVSDRAAVDAVLAKASERFGGLGSVVYAGGPRFDPAFFSATPPETWRTWFDQDVIGCINLAQGAIPHLRKTAGSFTTLSTYQNNKIEVCGSVSSISKAALDRAVVAIAKEEGRHGVRANSVRAGWFAVELNQRLFETVPGLADEKKRAIPLRRLGTEQELGDVVVFLASKQAGFVNGVNLTVDGGESI